MTQTGKIRIISNKIGINECYWQAAISGRFNIGRTLIAMCEDYQPNRCRALKDELEQLSWLNRAMFERLFDGHVATSDWISHAFDRTDPARDECSAERNSDLRIDGDFFLIKQVDPYVYIIVGDATGHHAYAGGLKVFIAAAVQRIFDSLAAEPPPEPGSIVELLQNVFSLVGGAQAGEVELGARGGANIAVVRIATTDGHSISYASAGLPIYALAKEGNATKLGEFSDLKGVRFPSSNDVVAPSIVSSDGPQAHDCAFLAIFSDGFRDHARQRPGQGAPTNEFFRAKSVLDVLEATVARENGEQVVSAHTLVEAVIAAAREFRKGCLVPEIGDDDRLIVVIDLTRLCSLSRT